MREDIPLDRVVIDTNNIISLFLKGDFAFFSHLKFKYQIELCTCQFQIEELKNVLMRKKPYFMKHLRLPADDYIEFFKNHSSNYHIDLRYDGIEDSNDNFLVDIAHAAKAFYIVSGDRKVLAKKHVKRIQIVGIKQFITKLKSQEK